MRYGHFKYGEYVYTPAGAKALSEKDLKAEYSRLRGVAVKRLARMKGTEYEQSELYKNYDGIFKKIAEFKNEEELKEAFSQVHRFLSGESSTLSAQKDIKARTIETLQNRGLNVNEGNYWQVMNFFSEVHEQKIDKIYGSEIVKDIINDVIDSGKDLSPELLQEALNTKLERNNDMDYDEYIESLKGSYDY